MKRDREKEGNTKIERKREGGGTEGEIDKLIETDRQAHR